MNDFQSMLEEKLKDAIIEDSDSDDGLSEYDVLAEIRDEMIKIRKAEGISQKLLAERTGISQANISKIENGLYEPSVSVLKRIADGLGRRLSVRFLDEEEIF